MWAAKCSYVRQLVPPLLFHDKMVRLNEAREYSQKQNQPEVESPLLHNLQANLFDNLGPYCLGTERYSNEHWIASHPSLQPCDARGVRLGTPMAPRNPWDHKNWRMIPRKNKRRLSQNKALRMQEYFLLPGYLFRCLFLYNRTLPPDTSWAWSWFPDGEEWKREAAIHGDQVVQVITERYAKEEATQKQKYY